MSRLAKNIAKEVKPKLYGDFFVEKRVVDPLRDIQN